MDNSKMHPLENPASKDPVIYYFRILLAGKKIEIECIHKDVFYQCRDYLAKFEDPDILIHTSPEDISREVIRTFGEIPLSAPSIATEYRGIESTVIYRKIAEAMISYNTLLVHGSVVAVENKCYLFTAQSGTGKTTHVLNWLKTIPGAYIVNGDKPLIDTESMLVYGTPWCGKEGMNTNTAVPLAGIISLERGEKNSIAPISFSEMLPVLLRQTYIPKERSSASKACSLLGRFKKIPCFRLFCNTDPESAVVAYEVLKEAVPQKLF